MHTVSRGQSTEYYVKTLALELRIKSIFKKGFKAAENVFGKGDLLVYYLDCNAGSY